MITINPALSESLSIPPCLQMPELFAAIRAAAIANQPRESEAAILRTLLRKRRIDAIAAVPAAGCDLDGPIESLDSAPLSPLPTLPSHILSAGWRRGDVRADANHAPPGVSPHLASLLRQGGDRPGLTAVEGDLVCGDGGAAPLDADLESASGFCLKGHHDAEQLYALQVNHSQQPQYATEAHNPRRYSLSSRSDTDSPRMDALVWSQGGGAPALFSSAVRPGRAMQAMEPSEDNAGPALAGAHGSKGRHSHAEASLEVLAAIERMRREVSATRRPRIIRNRFHRLRLSESTLHACFPPRRSHFPHPSIPVSAPWYTRAGARPHRRPRGAAGRPHPPRPSGRLGGPVRAARSVAGPRPRRAGARGQGLAAECAGLLRFLRRRETKCP
jgi:hypothetical protein